jgi:hypothetical protein
MDRARGSAAVWSEITITCFKKSYAGAAADKLNGGATRLAPQGETK